MNDGIQRDRYAPSGEVGQNLGHVAEMFQQTHACEGVPKQDLGRRVTESGVSGRAVTPGSGPCWRTEIPAGDGL